MRDYLFNFFLLDKSLGDVKWVMLVYALRHSFTPTETRLRWKRIYAESKTFERNDASDRHASLRWRSRVYAEEHDITERGMGLRRRTRVYVKGI